MPKSVFDDLAEEQEQQTNTSRKPTVFDELATEEQDERGRNIFSDTAGAFKRNLQTAKRAAGATLEAMGEQLLEPVDASKYVKPKEQQPEREQEPAEKKIDTFSPYALREHFDQTLTGTVDRLLKESGRSEEPVADQGQPAPREQPEMLAGKLLAGAVGERATGAIGRVVKRVLDPVKEAAGSKLVETGYGVQQAAETTLKNHPEWQGPAKFAGKPLEEILASDDLSVGDKAKAYWLRMVENSVPFLTSFGLSAIGTASGNPTVAALGQELAAATMFAQEAGGAYESIIQDNPATDRKEAAKASMVVGLINQKLERMVPEATAKGSPLLNRTLKETARREIASQPRLYRALVKGIESGKGEFTTEMFQELTQNIARKTFDENVDLREGLIEAGLVGFGMGAGASGTLEMITPTEKRGEPTPSDALLHNQAVLNLKQRNLPTRDLLALKGNPMLGRLGITPEDIDAVLDERAGDMLQARANINPNAGPISRTAAASAKEQMAEIILSRAEDRRIAQEKADIIGFGKDYRRYEPEPPAAKEQVEVEGQPPMQREWEEQVEKTKRYLKQKQAWEAHDAWQKKQRADDETLRDSKIPEEVKRSARQEASRIVSADPVYEHLAEIKKRGKLNLEATKQDYDEDTVSQISRRYPGLFSKVGTLNPDEIADELGYESLRDMFDRFSAAKTKKELMAEIMREQADQWKDADEQMMRYGSGQWTGAWEPEMVSPVAGDLRAGRRPRATYPAHELEVQGMEQMILSNPEGIKEEDLEHWTFTSEQKTRLKKLWRESLGDAEESKTAPAAEEETAGAEAGGKESMPFPDLGQNEKINGITRAMAGDLIAAGDEEVLDHIREGIKKHGPELMSHVIRNQAMAEIGAAIQDGKDWRAVQERIAKLQPQIDAILKGEESPPQAQPEEESLPPEAPEAAPASSAPEKDKGPAPEEPEVTGQQSLFTPEDGGQKDKDAFGRETKKAGPATVILPHDYLMSAQWDGKGKKIHPGGDINNAYSGPQLTEDKIKKPFKFQGKLFTVTSGVHGKTTAWTGVEIVPAEQWKGETYTYKEIVDQFDETRQRGDSTGHLVKFGKKEYVLTGNEIIFESSGEVEKPATLQEAQEYWEKVESLHPGHSIAVALEKGVVPKWYMAGETPYVDIEGGGSRFFSKDRKGNISAHVGGLPDNASFIEDGKPRKKKSVFEELAEEEGEEKPEKKEPEYGSEEWHEDYPFYSEGTVRAEKQVKETITQEQADEQLEEWIAVAEAQAKNKNGHKTILSLFDVSGVWSAPFIRAGFNVIQIDKQNGIDVNDISIEWLADNGIDDVYGILAACPCTDFASSGARWWAAKDEAGTTEQSKELVFQTHRLVEFFRPKFWALENPVGRIAKLTGMPKPHLIFQPHHYGDPYTKKTMLWGLFNADLPQSNVEPSEGSRTVKLRGDVPDQKKIRSITPEGFAYAFFMANGDVQPGTVEKAKEERKAAGKQKAAGESEKPVAPKKQIDDREEPTWAVRLSGKKGLRMIGAQEGGSYVFEDEQGRRVVYQSARHKPEVETHGALKDDVIPEYPHQSKYLTKEERIEKRKLFEERVVKYKKGERVSAKIFQDGKARSVPATIVSFRDISMITSTIDVTGAGLGMTQPVVKHDVSYTVKSDGGAIKDSVFQDDISPLGAEGESTERGEDRAAGYGDSNKLFTKDAAEKARELLRQKLKTQLGAGIDPEIFQAGVQLAGYHVEAGARTFAAYSKAMIEDLGEAIKPYLKVIYNAVRDWPGMNSEGMTPADEIDKYLREQERGKAPGFEVGDYLEATPESGMNLKGRVSHVQSDGRVRIGGRGAHFNPSDFKKVDRYFPEGIPTTMPEYSEILKSDELKEAWQDALDSVLTSRVYAIRNILTAKGWTGEIDIEHHGAGRNVVGVKYDGMQDMMDAPPEDFAEKIYRQAPKKAQEPSFKVGDKVRYSERGAKERIGEITNIVPKTNPDYGPAYFVKKDDGFTTLIEPHHPHKGDTLSLVEEAGETGMPKQPGETSPAKEPELRIQENVWINTKYGRNEYILITGNTKEHVGRIRSAGKWRKWLPRKQAWRFPQSQAETVKRNLADLLEGELVPEQAATSTTAVPGDQKQPDTGQGLEQGDIIKVEKKKGESNEQPEPRDTGPRQAEADDLHEVERPASEKETDRRDSETDHSGSRGRAPSDQGVRSGRPHGDRGDDRGTRDDVSRVPDEVTSHPQTSLTAGNYRLSDDEILALEKRSETRRIKDNLEAIRIVKDLQASGRKATAEDQSALARFSGWGGLIGIFNERTDRLQKEREQLQQLLTQEEFEAARSSSRTAHYTSPTVIHGIYNAIHKLGVSGQVKILEPSVGVGNFLGLMPSSMRNGAAVTGIELDTITGSIARYLYPRSNIVAPRGFQEIALKDNSFDVVIGNPPFNNVPVRDKTFAPEGPDGQPLKMTLHNFFFAKSLHVTRPGGIMALVVSRYMMDQVDSMNRSYLARHAELIGAIRLPDNAFLSNTGTSVTTDIILLQKREQPLEWDEARALDWVDTGTVPDPDGGEDITINQYFVKNPDMMLGDMTRKGTMYRGDQATLSPREGKDLASALAAVTAKLTNVYKKRDNTAVDLEPVKADPDIPDGTKIHAYFITPEGKLRQRIEDEEGQQQSGPPVRYSTGKNEDVSLTAKQVERAKGMVMIRNALGELLEAERTAPLGDVAIESNRIRLNMLYDQFVRKHGFMHDQGNKLAFSDDPDYPRLLALEEGYDKGVSPQMARKLGVRPEKAKARKADIFRERVIVPERTAKKADSAKDALSISLNETGMVDLGRMMELTGKDESQIVDELQDVLFNDPEEGWVTSDQYLSGNVKAKLATAKAAAQKDNAFQRNVAELEKVQPADVDPVDISVRVSSPWLPADVLDDFAQHLLGARFNGSFNNLLGSWTGAISASSDPTKSRQWGTEALSGAKILEKLILNHNIKVMYRDKDNVKRMDVDATQEANAKADEIKREFIDWIWDGGPKEKVIKRRQRLSRIYNDQYNNMVERQYDGSHLTFPGMTNQIKLRGHQRDAAWRSIQEGRVLLDHVVGAGKTFTMISAAVEMKRMGLLNKPMFVVPNHLIEQWAADFYRLYPNVKLLAAGKKDFSSKNRKKLFSRIATGNWDAVIVAHSSFGKIMTPADETQEYLREQIRQYEIAIGAMEDEDAPRSIIRQMENHKDKLADRLQAVLDRQDDIIDFGLMGIDALFVDEAHQFKNLGFATRKASVPGLGDTTGSQKADDLFIKGRIIQKRNKGRGIFFATGTPVSNSLAEMFTMQRYLDYDELMQRGIASFDPWADIFADTETKWELDPTGVQYKLKTRFAKFVNMDELMGLYRSFADVVSQDHLIEMARKIGKRWPIPKIKGGKPRKIIIERSPLQAAYMDYVVDRAENMDPKKKREDNMLKLTTDATKAALDMRLIDSRAPDFPGSKPNVAVREIFDIYQQWDARRGTQLVFLDYSAPKKSNQQARKQYQDLVSKAERGDALARAKLDKLTPADLAAMESEFSVYDDMRAKLVAKGVPDNQIAFIHDANTDLQKAELQEKVRRGEVRILFGSTEKMGAGMNVQNRLVALHHIDAPWRPSDLEQREGRILRQGNEFYLEDPDNFEIIINRYATKETYDARRWQIIEGKAVVVESLRNYDPAVGMREVEDIAGEAANAAEMKAAASGDPLVIEQVTLAGDIKTLESLAKSHAKKKRRMEGELQLLQESVGPGGELDLVEKYLERFREATKGTDDIFSAVINGEDFSSEYSDNTKQNKENIQKARKDAAKAVVDHMMRLVDQGEVQPLHKIGSKYRGLTLWLSVLNGASHFSIVAAPEDSIPEDIPFYLRNTATITYSALNDDKFSGVGFFTRLDNLVQKVTEEFAEKVNREREYREREIKGIEESMPGEFKQAAELKQKRERLDEVIKILGDRKADTVANPLRWLEMLAGSVFEDSAGDTLESMGEGDIIEESGVRYEISQDTTTSPAEIRDEAGRAAIPNKTGQLALFARERTERRQKKFLESYPAKIGTFHYDDETVDDHIDAARLLSPITAKAQEVMAVLVLDKKRRPIAVLQHSSGTPNQNTIAPGHLIGSILNLRGANSFWIAHNHPSGNDLQSPHDVQLTERIQNGVVGVIMRGHLVMTPLGNARVIDGTVGPDGSTGTRFTFTPPTGKKTKVRVTERRLKGEEFEHLAQMKITNSADAKEAVAEFARGMNGILFLDQAHRPVRFIHATMDQMKNLRRGDNESLAADLYRFIDKRNSVPSVILNFKDGNDLYSTAGQNMVNFFAQAGVNVLDIVSGNESAADNGIVAQMRLKTRDTDFVFYSRGSGEITNNTPANVEREIAVFVGKGGAGDLIDSGRVVILRTDAGLPRRLYQKRTSAVTDNDGTIYLVANRIPKGQAVNVLLHELGLHYGYRAIFGEDQAQRIFDAFARMKDREGKAGDAVRRAFERVPTDTPKSQINEEALAYFIQEQKNYNLPLHRRILARIKEWLVKLGFNPDILTQEDLVTLAVSAVRREAKGGIATAIESYATAMRSGTGPRWHSRLVKIIDQKGMKAAPAKEWARTLRQWQNKGTIPMPVVEELEWSGLKDWLNMQAGKVSKADILNFLNNNGVQIEEVEKGGDPHLFDSEVVAEGLEWHEVERFLEAEMWGGEWDFLNDEDEYSYSEREDGLYDVHRRVEREEEATVYSKWQLPGGKSYRELLIILPRNDQAVFDLQSKQVNAPDQFTEADQRKLDSLINNTRTDFQSDHYTEPNILAHVRFNERTDADGNRVLFIEEIQSDWHQKGRKEGYKTKAVVENMTLGEFKKIDKSWAKSIRDAVKIHEKRNIQDDAPVWIIRNPETQDIEEITWREDQLQASIDDVNKMLSAGVPNAPFKTSWPMLAMKRMIRYAAENGFDKVAWTTGEMQAERYDMSHQLDTLDYWEINPFAGKERRSFGIVGMKDGDEVAQKFHIWEDELSGFVGKEMAEKIINGEGKLTSDDSGEPFRRLSGLDLKVGGHGMIAFYDKMLPTQVQRFIKKYGGEVGTATIQLSEGIEGGKFDDYLDEIMEHGGLSVPSFTITPEMKATALGHGMPLFSRQPEFQVETFDDILSDLLGDAAETLNTAKKEIRTKGLNARNEARAIRAITTMADAKRDDAEATRKWWNRLDEKAQAGMLQLLTLRQIRHIFARENIQVARYYKGVRELAADTTRMMKEADELYNRWAGLPKEVADALAEVMTEATVLQFDPASKKKKTHIHKDLIKRYNALPEEAQAVYRLVRNQYTTNLYRLRDALLERLIRTAGKNDYIVLKKMLQMVIRGERLNPDNIAELMEQVSGDGRSIIRNMDVIRLKFEKYLKEGPYFPLARFGKYVVQASKGNRYDRQHFETLKARDKHAAKMKAEGWTVKTDVLVYSKELQGASESFVSGVMGIIDNVDGLEPSDKEMMMDQVNQLFIKSMPDLSHRKHFAHRTYTPGYSRDQLRAFAENMQHAAHHISKIRHADKLTKALREMEQRANKTREGDVGQDRFIYEELAERFKMLMEPNIKPVAQAFTAFGFFMNIGPSIASALVNLSQTPLVAYPMMAAKFKANKSAAVWLSKASQAYFGSPFELDKGFNMAENLNISEGARRMFRELFDDGTIDATQVHSLAQAASPDYLNLAKTKHGHQLAKLSRLVSYPFHVAEVANREITAYATYELCRAKGMTHAQAVHEAREMVLDSHFDYSHANRARIMEGNFRRVLLLFKQYSQQMTFLLGRSFIEAARGTDPETKRIARAQLLGILGGHFLVSGVLGMPVIGLVADVMQMLVNMFGDDDDPFDWEVEMRNFLSDHLGKTAGAAISKGPASLLGWDVSGRMSLSDLWYRKPNREAEGREKFHQLVDLVGGPVFTNVANMFQGLYAMEEGHLFRGIEYMMPKFIKDAMKSIRYAREGVRSWNDDTLLEELGYLELFGQFLGFTPYSVAEMYAGKSAIKNREHKLDARRQRLINAWVRNTKNGDVEKAQATMDKIVSFNRKNPLFTVTGGTLMRSYRQRLKVQSQTSRGVYMPATKAGLREEGRFADF